MENRLQMSESKLFFFLWIPTKETIHFRDMLKFWYIRARTFKGAKVSAGVLTCMLITLPRPIPHGNVPLGPSIEPSLKISKVTSRLCGYELFPLVETVLATKACKATLNKWCGKTLWAIRRLTSGCSFELKSSLLLNPLAHGDLTHSLVPLGDGWGNINKNLSLFLSFLIDNN